MNPQTNVLIQKLLSTGSFTEADLKKAYRELVKSTHPDMTGLEGDEFLQIQADYEDAKSFLEQHRRIKPESPLPRGRADARAALYLALEHYNAAGLHSARVRLKPQLRERNRRILTEIVTWAVLYDPEFLPIFFEYNRTYLEGYSDWGNEKIKKNIKKCFLYGFAAFLDYQRGALIGTKRTALSYLEETEQICILMNMEESFASALALTKWLRAELEKPPVGRHAPRPLGSPQS